MDENVIHGDQLENGEEWTDHPALDGKWRNYGDANPDLHGGAWVRFDPDGEYWEAVNTTSGHDLPADYLAACLKMEESEVTDDILDKTQLVESTQVYPDEIWSDGEPDRTGMDESGEPVYGWSEFMTNVEISMGPYTADGNMDFGFIESSIGNDWFFQTGDYSMDEPRETTEYADLLASYGITPKTAADPDYYDFW